MCRNDVLAFVEKPLDLFVHGQHHVVHPGLAGGGNLCAVHVQLEHIVMGILQDEFFLQLVGGEFHFAADVDVAAFAAPSVADEGEVGRTPGGLLLLPCAGVEGLALPSVFLHLIAYAAGPAFLVGHGGDGHEGEALCAHETIGLSVYTEQSEQGLLVVGPVACGAVGEFVIGRPDGEIGVVHYNGHRGQAQLCGRIGGKQVGCRLLVLLAAGKGCADRQKRKNLFRFHWL